MRDTCSGPLATSIESYLAHKRSLGKQLVTVGKMLHLLDRYLLAHGVTQLHQVTSVHMDEFVASRQRHSTRSYNELIGGCEGCSIGWSFMKNYRRRHCNARLAATSTPAGRFFLASIKPGCCWKRRRNCRITRVRLIEARCTG